MFQSGICGCQREKKLRISSSSSSYNYFLNTIFFFFFLDILQLTPCFSRYLPLLISPFLFLLSHKSPPTRYSGIIPKNSQLVECLKKSHFSRQHSPHFHSFRFSKFNLLSLFQMESRCINNRRSTKLYQPTIESV